VSVRFASEARKKILATIAQTSGAGLGASRLDKRYGGKTEFI